MAVSYKCPNPGCGVALKTPLRVPSGKSVSCPKCGMRFVAEPVKLTPNEESAPHDSLLGLSEPPQTRAQDPADRARLAPVSTPTAEPIRLNFSIDDPVPGLSSWLLERQLGVGGFGEVWLAKHEWKPDRRAVKFFTHPEARYRLVTHEKKVLVRVMKYAGGHPNIVPLLECNLDGETPWLMYEYVPGGTLIDAVREWQNRRPTKRLSKAAKALLVIAGAIGHCHRVTTPIVHRDLKPANVLRDESHVLRVTDFGIGGAAVAHLAEGQTHGFKTSSGRVPTLIRAAGSFGYASPQQRNGDSPDPRDDVYSLGVLAFQMFLGDFSLWPGPDMADDLRALGLPSGVVHLLRNSVSHTPSRRPEDAQVWKVMLEACTIRSSAINDTKSGVDTNTPAPGPLRSDGSHISPAVD